MSIQLCLIGYNTTQTFSRTTGKGLGLEVEHLYTSALNETLSFLHTVMDHPRQPHDCNIQLLKNDTLGSGSYGTVCKAMWGQRLCAAKLLHPIFFHSNDPGFVTTRRRFEQECRFLNDMKHPHVVEYFGTSHDPDSGLLVLLMELMDESLTHFLERSQQPLAYHIEVDLCHNIALALAYIHSKDIIHRDLSGNNVLLLAGRAKITDFGQSKLLDANRRMTPLTTCPGTLAYMPPEALREPPGYSKKIDCFSFGVLQIQIMTRQFPDPGPAIRVVEDLRSPTGVINIPVLESERRKSHIDLIDPTHTLLPTALGCLSYSEKDRPSAQDLCQQLAAVKEAEAPRYQLLQDSQRCTNVRQQKGIKDMGWQQEPTAPQKMYRGSAAVDANIAYFNGRGLTTVHSYDSDAREWHRLPDAPHTRSTLVVVHHILTMVGGLISGRATDSLLSLMGEGRGKKWLPHLPAMPTKRYFTATVCSGHSLIVAGGSKDGSNIVATVEVLDTEARQWSIASSLTCPLTDATISICGERLYMLGGFDQTGYWTRSVLTCSIPELLQSCQTQPLAGKLRTAPANTSTIWRQVADAPHYKSSCATFCEQLVAVGGMDEAGFFANDTSTITVYNETIDSWEAMGNMPTARRRPLVAILNGKMIVVGGRAGGWGGSWLWQTKTDVVELFC